MENLLYIYLKEALRQFDLVEVGERGGGRKRLGIPLLADLGALGREGKGEEKKRKEVSVTSALGSGRHEQKGKKSRFHLPGCDLGVRGRAPPG